MKSEVAMTLTDDEVQQRLQRLEIVAGEMASGIYGPSIGGSTRSPAATWMIANYERLREEQALKARVARAEQELAQLKVAA